MSLLIGKGRCCFEISSAVAAPSPPTRLCGYDETRIFSDTLLTIKQRLSYSY